MIYSMAVDVQTLYVARLVQLFYILWGIIKYSVNNVYVTVMVITVNQFYKF